MGIELTPHDGQKKRLSPGWSNTRAFCVQGHSADVSACETLKTAPETGWLVLDSMQVICCSEITVRIGCGQNEGSVANVIWGPLPFGKAFQFQWAPARQVWLPQQTALTIDASGPGEVLCLVEGVWLS